MFTTFNISSERTVEAYYFPPENQLNNAIISIYRKTPTGQVYMANPTKYLYSYLEAQGIEMRNDIIVPNEDEQNNIASKEEILDI